MLKIKQVKSNNMKYSRVVKAYQQMNVEKLKDITQDLLGSDPI